MQGDSYKFSCITVDSIRLISETSNLPEISIEAATTLSEDATSKLKQVISRARGFMKHARRTQLTCADINKALRWSDSQPVLGYESNPTGTLDYSFSTDAKVFVYHNETVDLSERYKIRTNLNEALTHGQLTEAVPEMMIKD